MVVKHVLIVGGGLAGPALALALARHNIRSTISELRPTRGDSGGSITLGPNALRALDKACGVYERLRSLGYVYTRMSVFDEQGYQFGEMLAGEEHPGGYPLVRILRSNIHKTLLDACEQNSDMITFVWGAKLAKIQESDSNVTAHFEDGSVLSADVLIGADGIHSQVREYILGSSAPKPVYIGSCTAAGFTTAHLVQTPPHMNFPAVFFTPSGILMGVPVDPEGRTLAWGISCDVEEKSREGWKEYQQSGEAIRQAKLQYADVHTNPLRSLLDNVDEASVNVWVPYSIPELPTWHIGRVCLIGDAAHALPPNGQGSAQAFEDAALLARMLASEQVMALGHDQLFTRFERLRKARIRDVTYLSKSAGQAKAATSSAWKWALKKWLVWAYFTWNWYVVKNTKITSYDVMAQDITME